MIVFVSGCTAKYKLTIETDNKFNENLNILEAVDTVTSILNKNNEGEDYVAYVDEYIQNLGSEIEKNTILLTPEESEYYNIDNYYEYDSKILNDNYNMSCLAEHFDFDTFLKLSILSKLSETKDITYDNDILSINISKLRENYVSKLDSIEIRIIPDYSVISNNAHSIEKENNKSVYIWKYDKDEPIDISIKMDTTMTASEQKEKKSTLILIILVVVLIASGILILLNIKNKSKKVNKI